MINWGPNFVEEEFKRNIGLTMEEVMSAERYWCHACSQVVNPSMEAELKCPFCHSGFVEEIDPPLAASGRGYDESDFASDSDRALSLWAPILLGIMGNPHRRQGLIRRHFLDDDDDDEGEPTHELYSRDHHLDPIIRRRRRSSATILQLLQSFRAGMVAADAETHPTIRNTTLAQRERIFSINPFHHETIVVEGSSNHNQNQNQNQNRIQTRSSFGSLNDYFIGPGLDLLLQHLAENDPNRYGTPPAQKEAIEALPTAKIEDNNVQCSVCLDDFELGAEAKEMPCKHKFHNDCLLPWLDLHSSCPVCRYQLVADDKSRRDLQGSRRNSSNIILEGQRTSNSKDVVVRDVARNGATARRLALPWPFSTFFSLTGPSSSSGPSSPRDSSPMPSTFSSSPSPTRPNTQGATSHSAGNSI